MLCKDSISIIYKIEHRNDLIKVHKQIYNQVERNDVCFDYGDRTLFYEYIFTYRHNIWKYRETSEITKGEFLIVENYFKSWFYDIFDDLRYHIFSFINGDVYTVEELDDDTLDYTADANRYKLTKHPYFKSRRDVYETFRSIYDDNFE